MPPKRKSALRQKSPFGALAEVPNPPPADAVTDSSTLSPEELLTQNNYLKTELGKLSEHVEDYISRTSPVLAVLPTQPMLLTSIPTRGPLKRIIQKFLSRPLYDIHQGVAGGKELTDRLDGGDRPRRTGMVVDRVQSSREDESELELWSGIVTCSSCFPDDRNLFFSSYILARVATLSQTQPTPDLAFVPYQPPPCRRVQARSTRRPDSRAIDGTADSSPPYSSSASRTRRLSPAEPTRPSHIRSRTPKGLLTQPWPLSQLDVFNTPAARSLAAAHWLFHSPMPRPPSASTRAGRRPLTESDRPPRQRLLPASAGGGNATRRHTRVPVSTAGEPAAPTRFSPCSPGAPDPNRLNHAAHTPGSRHRSLRSRTGELLCLEGQYVPACMLPPPRVIHAPTYLCALHVRVVLGLDRVLLAFTDSIGGSTVDTFPVDCVEPAILFGSLRRNLISCLNQVDGMIARSSLPVRRPCPDSCPAPDLRLAIAVDPPAPPACVEQSTQTNPPPSPPAPPLYAEQSAQSDPLPSPNPTPSTLPSDPVPGPTGPSFACVASHAPKNPGPWSRPPKHKPKAPAPPAPSARDPIRFVASFGGTPPPSLFSTPHADLFHGLTLALSLHTHISGVRLLGAHWNKACNLVLAFPPDSPETALLSALPVLRSTLHLEPSTPLSRITTWSKVMVSSVPAREHVGSPTYSEDALRESFAANPSFTSLSVTRPPRWIRNPAAITGAHSSFTLSFEDHDGSVRRALSKIWICSGVLQSAPEHSHVLPGALKAQVLK
ncbi:hypothetical protein BDV93DRAFT_555175 [Ceratobasidium sp. AG-I]|nr:hypothetical protein BDV93DRAFT_555175 [Ceratobasidium sp. AG-I]